MENNFIGVSYLSPSADVVCKAKQSHSLSPIGSPLPDLSPAKPQASSVKSYDLFCSNSPEMANLIDLSTDYNALPGSSPPVMRNEYKSPLTSPQDLEFHQYAPELDLIAKLESWALTPPLTPPSHTPVLSASPIADPGNILYNHQDQPWIDEWLSGMGGMEMDPNMLDSSLSNINPNWGEDDYKNMPGFNHLSPEDLLSFPEYPYPSPSSSGSVSPHHKYEDDLNAKMPGSKLTEYYPLASPIEIPVHKKAPARSVKPPPRNPTSTNNNGYTPDRVPRYPYDVTSSPQSNGSTHYRSNNGNSIPYPNNVPNSEPDVAPYLVKPGFVTYVSPASEDILMDGKSRSRSAGEALLRQKSTKSLSPIHHYKYRHKAKMARYRRSSNKEDLTRFELVIEKVLSGQDVRTTLMIKNIPNKYDQEMLLEAINHNFKGSYDFFYLPIDFKNKCNVGYAFINFIHYLTVANFYGEFNQKKWEKFNSEKVCHITYARIQGKSAFIDHFRNSSLMNEDPACRPLIFHSSGPYMGQLESFPPANVRMSETNTDSL